MPYQISIDNLWVAYEYPNSSRWLYDLYSTSDSSLVIYYYPINDLFILCGQKPIFYSIDGAKAESMHHEVIVYK